jgi:hypothetical protein
MYLSESNFKRAKEFIPERWLGAAEVQMTGETALTPSQSAHATV